MGSGRRRDRTDANQALWEQVWCCLVVWCEVLVEFQSPIICDLCTFCASSHATTWLARAGTHKTDPSGGRKNLQNGIYGSSLVWKLFRTLSEHFLYCGMSAKSSKCSENWLWKYQTRNGPKRVRATRYTRVGYPGRVETATKLSYWIFNKVCAKCVSAGIQYRQGWGWMTQNELVFSTGAA